jgi:hypothetical protein
MTEQHRHGSDSPEYRAYLDIERQFTILAGRAIQLPELLRIRALLGWYAEVVAALRELGVDPAAEEDTEEAPHEGNGLA